MNNEFYFGSVYIIEQDVPLEEKMAELKYMKDTGFNLITLWPAANAWLCDDPLEFKFDETLKVLDRCEELGMKAIIQLFGQNHSQEFLPDALVTPEMQISSDVPADVNCIWANLNHPEVRTAMNRYLEISVNALKDHPAVFGWDAFNEAHFCSNDPWTQAEYRKWLEKEYGDINLLNRKWYRRYKDFSQIDPQFRRAPYSIWSSLLPAVEYEMFRSENLTDICRWIYDEVKKHDSDHPVIIDGTSGHILYPEITLRNNDEFRTAEIPDIYGATFYPKSWGRNLGDDPCKCSLYFSVPFAAARAAGKPYYVNELQTHTQSVLTPGSEVEPEELAIWTWMNIAIGAKGFQLWRWRPFRHGYQATGRGLTRIDGQSSPRQDAIADLVKVIRQDEAAFSSCMPLSPAVKIAVSYRGRLFHDSLHKWQENELPDAILGWYRAFWETGVPVSLADLDNPAEFDPDTPVIVLPSTLRISDEILPVLENYVKEGGTLIADARLGALNDWGEVPQEGLPGKRLSDLFGFKEIDVTECSVFDFCGERINAPFMSQIIEISEETDILAMNDSGQPAVISKYSGKGRTIYFNSFAGLHWRNGLNAAQQDFFRQLVLDRDSKQIYADKSSSVNVYFQKNDDTMLVFMINFNDIPETVMIHNHTAKTEPVMLNDGSVEPVKNELHCVVPARATSIIKWSV